MGNSGYYSYYETLFHDLRQPRHCRRPKLVIQTQATLQPHRHLPINSGKVRGVLGETKRQATALSTPQWSPTYARSLWMPFCGRVKRKPDVQLILEELCTRVAKVHGVAARSQHDVSRIGTP